MGRSWKKKKKTLLYKISSDRMGFHSRSHTAMALQWLREPRGEASQFLPSQLPALNSGGSNTKNALLTLLASMFVARAVCKKSWESRKKWLCSAQGWLCNVAEAIRRQIYWVKAVTVKEDKFWLSSRNALLAQEGLFPRGRPMLQLVPVPLGAASGPSISGTPLGWGRYLQGIPQCLLAYSWASPHPEASPCTPWPPPLWGLPGLTPVWQSLWAPNQPQYLGVISQVPSRGQCLQVIFKSPQLETKIPVWSKALLPAQFQDLILEASMVAPNYLFFTSRDFWNFHFKMFCGFCPTVMLATRDSTIFFLKLGFLNFPSRGSTCFSSESKGRKLSVFKKKMNSCFLNSLNSKNDFSTKLNKVGLVVIFSF